MKRLILLVMLALPIMAKDQYKICVASQAGQGCSHEVFSKKTIFKIRDILATAPIPADYAVWVEDTKGNTVRGPNDPAPQAAPQQPVTDEKREKL